MCDFSYQISPIYPLILAYLCGFLFVVSVSVEFLPLSLSARLYTIFLVTAMGIIMSFIYTNVTWISPNLASAACESAVCASASVLYCHRFHFTYCVHVNL